VTAAPDRVRAEPRGGVTYPVQLGKIQAPALRDETLARTRLLDWLDVKIHSRVLFVIADAGYGKTTLLADFSRRTRLRTIWYRLDEDDRDWVGFLAHLVAAGREFDPAFAPRTAGILRSLEPGGPTREDAIETFLAELPSIAGDGAALIFDDFHFADEAADIRHIAREIISRGPERLSVIFASRRAPSVPVAKLRALGELAEIGINDLRFSDAEMEQLFRETYGRPLEPDVLTELANRTEGWAASLTLIQAALRERSPAETRSFVRSLTGAHDELHDYLAEEVVGDLPASQQQFLMRTSILQRVTPELAQVATGLTAGEVQSMVAEAERLGMLGRRTNRRSAEQRYHPLVREFLEDRLRRDVGPAGVDDLHVTVATWAEPSDWQTAAHHFAAAQRSKEVQSVLEQHLQTIVSSGAFAPAAEFVRRIPGSPRSATTEVIASRQASVEGDITAVAAHAEAAAKLDPDNEVVIANLITSKLFAGELRGALEIAESFAVTATSDLMRRVAHATTVLIKVSLDFDLREAAAIFDDLAEHSNREHLAHFEGVSLLNAAAAYRVAGSFDVAWSRASQAADLLAASSSGNELSSAHFERGAVAAYRGDLDEARRIFHEAGSNSRHGLRTEYLVHLADIEAQIGDADRSHRLLAEVDERVAHAMERDQVLVASLLAIRSADYAAAERILSREDLTLPTPSPGHRCRVLATQALTFALLRRSTAESYARQAMSSAERQHANLWRALASLAVGASSGQLDAAILELPSPLLCTTSMAAELVVENLDQLGGAARSLVVDEALRRPDRWLPAIRRATQSGSRVRPHASRLLADAGQASDVILLGASARQHRSKGEDRRLAQQLARRLAPIVVVEDLGRVTILIGSRVVGGHEVRRKVLALLCFLLTRPRFSATREEVMEAMWPDMEPSAAINSLNQSVYFLRRVFEIAYTEDTTAGYLHQDSDVVWLDNELLQSRSNNCAHLIAAYERRPDPRLAIDLGSAYSGKFALDFSYEEWSVDYRDWLHIAYLRIVESQVRQLIDSSEFDAGVAMARRALQIDPRNEDLELSLLQLLRSVGAHSAAAEQYAHYATLLRRDLGIEPPPLESV